MNSQIGFLDPATAREYLAAPLSGRPPKISQSEYEARVNHARSLMRQQGMDAMLISAGTSLRYFSGIPWGGSERLVAMLITASGTPIVIAPTFEEGSLDAVLTIDADKRLWEEHEDPHAEVLRACRECGVRCLGLDPEAPYRIHAALSGHAAALPLSSAQPVIDGCRMAKSPQELALMQHACNITLQVLRVTAGRLQEGMGTDAIVRSIDEAHRALGADNGSTFCIVQLAHATAFPHGIPGVQHLRENDLVLIDTGCSVEGYNSDITRTFVFGRANDDQKRIWALEQAAQRAAFDTVRPGEPCESVDRAARQVLEAAGLGPDYRLPGLPHRTGHGCGLAIHEAPYLVRGNTQLLQPGMCCSNEPMIVVPNQFGVRLEDHFYVTENAAQWFTPPAVAIDQPFVEGLAVAA